MFGAAKCGQMQSCGAPEKAAGCSAFAAFRLSFGCRQIRRETVAEYVVEFGKDGRPVEPDGRLDAAAFHRNHAPIWAVLQKFLVGRTGDVVEAGSGTAQHIVS